MGWSMVSTSSQRQFMLALVWLATTATLAVGLQLFDSNQAFGDDGQSAVVGMAVEYPLAGPDPAAESLPSALYAGLMWSVVETRVTPAQGLMDRAEVQVDLKVRNTLAVTQLRAPASMLALVSSESPVVIGARLVDAGRRLAVEPDDTKTVTAVFELGFSPNPSLDTLSLRIGEPNRVPAIIALGPTSAAAASTVFVAVETTPTAAPDPDDSSRQIVVQPSAASIDINAGPYRAAEDERLAVVKVVLQRVEVTDESTFLTPGYWALEASTGTVAPVLVARGAEAAANADEVTLVFTFPADAQNLSLVAGPGQPQAVSFSVVVPAPR